MNNQIKPKSCNFGITNKTKDGMYVLFADFDDVYVDVLLDDLRNLLKRFPNEFTNFAIFNSSPPVITQNGVKGCFHAVSFSKFAYQDLRERLKYLSVDEGFFRLPAHLPYRSNTLRISPKYKYRVSMKVKAKILKDAPRFNSWFPEKPLKVKLGVSTAHLKAFELNCGLKPLGDNWKEKQDGLDKVYIRKYFSAKA